MKESLLNILRCPVCKGELNLIQDERCDDAEETTISTEIEKGTLRCSDCEIDYPIEEGIPNMLPQEISC